MGLTKDEKREYQREYMRKRRSNNGSNIEDGSNKEGLTNEGSNSVGLTSYPDIVDKLTDPFWRDRLGKVCQAFKDSHHPEYVGDVWLGNTNLAVACDWLECTQDVPLPA